MELLPQRKRLAVLVGNLGLLIVTCRLAQGSWIPYLDDRGLWFYSGLFAFLTGTLMEAPTHTTPAQAFTFATLALIATFGFGLPALESLDLVAKIGWYLAIAFELSCLLAAIVAIVWKEQVPSTAAARLGTTAYLIARLLGRPAVIASAPFLFAVMAYHRAPPSEGLTLALAWSVLVFGRPLENVIALWTRIKLVWMNSAVASELGTIVGHGVPRLLTIRHGGQAWVEPGTPLLVRGDDGRANVALALSYVGVSDGLWLKALQLQLPDQLRQKLPVSALLEGRCAVVQDTALVTELEAEAGSVMDRRTSLAGVVAPGTDINTLVFEVIRSDLLFREGRLLEASIRQQPVMYQLLNGLTREDIVQQKNTRGYIVARARKVGTWSAADQRFLRTQWIPNPNDPVFLVDIAEPVFEPGAVGMFPGTSFPVRVDPSDLVTHNTAILGILGIGKTFLALELVERMILAGIKVICLDLTDQYADELALYIDAARQSGIEQNLRQVGQAGNANVQLNVEEGGSIVQFSTTLASVMRAFLAPDGPDRLLVLNPNAYEVWRQDSKPYQGRASMATLTAAEITRLVSETALGAAQALGMTATARCCLVYEEAHSLVPEWNAVANDGDKTAANGTARAILQGRKFGLGCLIVTQRTANVTKSILNQCNTVFAMRLYDATGIDFLANYLGDDYAAVLSGLEERHAVVFGKACSCADPVIIQVNERALFVRHARAPGIGVQAVAAPAAAAE
jgi:hypothetical protein